MMISRDRYLDDTRLYQVTVALQTRTHEMHSLLSDAPEDVRERVADILVQALDQVQGVLGTQLRRTAPKDTMSFGCGT